MFSPLKAISFWQTVRLRQFLFIYFSCVCFCFIFLRTYNEIFIFLPCMHAPQFLNHAQHFLMNFGSILISILVSWPHHLIWLMYMLRLRFVLFCCCFLCCTLYLAAEIDSRVAGMLYIAGY